MPAVASTLADMFADAPPTVNASDIGQRIGVSRQAVAAWARAGRMPRPVSGPWLRPRWRTGEVVEWLRKLEAAPA